MDPGRRGSSDAPTGGAPTPVTPTYSVAVTVSGLNGSGLILQNNGTDNLAIGANGVATFTTPLASGSGYAVSIFRDPSAPTQWCQVGRGGGTVGAITNISVVCRNGARAAYAANEGSNTVSQYTVSGADGTLSAIAPGAVSTDATPRGITVDPTGRYADVVNAGNNTVSQYTVSATTGALIPIAPSTASTANTPTSMAIDPTGRYAYVTNNGNLTLSQFSISTVNGNLTPMTPSTVLTGNGPISGAVR